MHVYMYLPVLFDPFQYSCKVRMMIGIQFVCFVCVCLLLYGLCGDGDQFLAAVSACGVCVCGSGAVLGEGFA